MRELIFCLPFVFCVSLSADPPSPYEVPRRISNNMGQAFREINLEKEQRQQRYVEARNSVYIMEMFDDYTPNRHQEFIDWIECSQLPPEDKLFVLYKMRKMKKSCDRDW